MRSMPCCPFCGSDIKPSPRLTGTYQHTTNIQECIIGDLGITDLDAWARRPLLSTEKAAGELREALEKAAKQFRFYEREHRTKAVGLLARAEVGEAHKSDVKANTNRDFADMCEAALAASEARGGP